MNGSVEKYRVSAKLPNTGRYNRWQIRWDLSPVAWRMVRSISEEMSIAMKWQVMSPSMRAESRSHRGATTPDGRQRWQDGSRPGLVP